MDILILGGAGQVGTELQALSWPNGVRVHAPDRHSLDITDAATVSAAYTIGARPIPASPPRA